MPAFLAHSVSLSVDAEVMVLPTENLRLKTSSCFKLAVSQNMPSYASPTARNPAFLISAFLLHSTSFFFISRQT